MPLHVDPRKHELLEARIQGSNHLKPGNNVPASTKMGGFPSYVYPVGDEPLETTEHMVLRGSSSPFSSAGDHDLSTNSSDPIKVVNSTLIKVSSEHVDLHQNVQNFGNQTVVKEELINVPNTHSITQTQLYDDGLTTLTTSKRCRLQNSTSEFDNLINPGNHEDALMSSPIKMDERIIESSQALNPPYSTAMQLSSPPCLQHSSRSNSTHTPTPFASGNSPVKFSLNCVNDRMLQPTTFQLSPSVTLTSTEGNLSIYLSSPSVRPITSTLTPQSDSQQSKICAKKKRKQNNFEDIQAQKPRKVACQGERGFKRIDEIFRCQPGPLYTSCDSTSPTRNQRPQSPSPSAGHSLDHQIGPTVHNYNPCFNETVTTSCSSYEQAVVTPTVIPQILSPIRGNSTTSLSDSSGDNPLSMACVSMTASANIPTSNVTSCGAVTAIAPAVPSAAALTYPSQAILPSTANSAYLTSTNGLVCPSQSVLSISSIGVNNIRSNVGVQTDESVIPSTSPSDPVGSVDHSLTLYNSSFISSVPTVPPLTSTLESLQRQIADLEREATVQRDTITKLQENALRSREVIRELLIEKSLLERKTTRQKVMENRLRLGQFVTQRQGAHFEEKWIEGSRFKELDQRRKDIELVREEIERKKKQWNKRKPPSGDGKKNIKSKGDEVSVDEFYEQLEIYDLRKQMLMKEDKEIQMELERLDRERNLHIREIKRIANEDASRFKDHPLLSERYLLLNLLGKGGFSEVHKGFDLVANRYVACKIHQLNPAWPKDKKDNYIKHALREIEIHKTLNHPRIVKVFDVFDIDHDAFCTVLEYSEGNDLDFFLKQNKSIPEREAKSIVCQVVSALKYLNERRPPVIHYDLKPGNILLGSGQVAGEIKITDFGLSKLMTEDKYNPETGMDLTSQGAGTYWYLPPECFETGREPPKISSKVDIWSVGVIFFQCLFGKKPFGHNMSQADILHENTILHARNIVFPSTTKVSDGAKEFIRKCCTYRKDLRPDVFQLCNDDFLKPKAQLKHYLDTSALPGPVGMPPTPCLLPGPISAPSTTSQCQAQHISHQSITSYSTLQSPSPSPILHNL